MKIEKIKNCITPQISVVRLKKKIHEIKGSQEENR